MPSSLLTIRNDISVSYPARHFPRKQKKGSTDEATWLFHVKRKFWLRAYKENFFLMKILTSHFEW